MDLNHQRPRRDSGLQPDTANYLPCLQNGAHGEIRTPTEYVLNVTPLPVGVRGQNGVPSRSRTRLVLSS